MSSMAASFSAVAALLPEQQIPIIASRPKPSSLGSVTATICMTPASSRRFTRCRTAASERPTASAIPEYERRPSRWRASMIALETWSNGGLVAETPVSAMDSIVHGGQWLWAGIDVAGRVSVWRNAVVGAGAGGRTRLAVPGPRGAGQPQRRTQLKRDLISHKCFGVIVRGHTALVTPSSHAHHRGLFVETASWLQFGDAEPVVVERNDAEQPHPASADRGADRHIVDGQRLGAARHRHGHPRPEFVVDALRCDHAGPHLFDGRIDDALPLEDPRLARHGVSRYRSKRGGGFLRCRRLRSLVPAVQQGRNLLEQELVEVPHLGQTLAGQAAIVGGGDPRFGGSEHG